MLSKLRCCLKHYECLCCRELGSLRLYFQAEDGIRDHCVTGVQTCALPIYQGHRTRIWKLMILNSTDGLVAENVEIRGVVSRQIGRAPCRESV